MNVYEVVKDNELPGAWRVEMIDGEGECEITIFSGARSEDRAKEYADWKGCVYE